MMKKQNNTSSSSQQLQKEGGKVKMGFVIQNTQISNPNAVTKKKEKSVSPQSQNLNTSNLVGQIESQQSFQTKVSKVEKQYISKLESQLKVQNKKKIDLVDNNNNLEYLLKMQDQKIQTYIEEIKQLRGYNEQLFKENKQLHLRVEGFAQERNHLLQDNKVLKETVKKLEVRLSLPVRPPQRKNVLKTVGDFSRENQYVDGMLLQNEQTIQQYGSTLSQAPNSSQFSRSNSPPALQENTHSQEFNHRGSLTNLHYRNMSNNSLQQHAILGNSQSVNNLNANSSTPGTSSSQSRSQLNGLPHSQQYMSQLNSHRSSKQLSQMQLQQQTSAHFNNAANQSSLLQTATLQADCLQANSDNYNQKLLEQIQVMEDERGTLQYEIKLLNQALSRDSSSEPMQKLIKDLVESQQRITQFTKNQAFLEDKINQFEKLVDSYTNTNPFEMDRASLEKKNTFLLQENQNLTATIKALKEEISLWNSNNHPLQIQQLEQERQQASHSNIMSTNSSRRGVGKYINKENNSPLSNRSNTRSLSQSPRSSGTLQAGSKIEKLTLAASIKNQKINTHGKDKLNKCCKDNKRLLNKGDKSSTTLHGSHSGSSFDIEETRRLLQIEKQKNQILSRMVEEEQEKNSEYLVYKEEMEFYHQKNKQMQNEITHLQNQMQLANLSLKVPIPMNANIIMSQGNSLSPRQTSQSPHQQVKRICNTQLPFSGTRKRAQSPSSPTAQGPLNYEPRSPQASGRNNTQTNDRYIDGEVEDEDGTYGSRVNTLVNKNKSKRGKNGNAINIEDESDQVLAFMQIEKELNQELQKKEKQIDNIINSRNLMQKTLGDQLKIIKTSNKELSESNRYFENQIIILNEEVKSLRILVKRAEKKNLIGNDFIPNSEDYY